ncbi:MAG: GNAT family N-acetyltransferase [Promethearchaeota archaeon]
MYPESLPIQQIFKSGESYPVDFIRFTPQWQLPTLNLILQGLKEHFETLDYYLNPDLDNISDFYNRPRQTFIIAICESQVVGSGALISESKVNPEPSGAMDKVGVVGRICRMSVDNSLRHQNIASSILFMLENEACRFGYKKIVLETTKEWIGVQKFYKSCGYVEEGEKNGDIHFFKTLEF